jgi:bifunctional non-homologous end joining protein LigD
MNLSGQRAIARAAKTIPVSLVVFDLLWLDGHDATGLPLEQRRELLELITEQDHRLQITAHVAGEGEALARQARELGLEGVMAKRLGSAYTPGRRSPDWRKIKLMNTQDCVVLGWTPGKGGRAGSFGALLVGAIVDGELRWVGQVGSGFTQRMLEDLMAQLAPIVRPDPPIEDPGLAAVKGATFVRPELVCEVQFLEMTKSTRKMRAPSFRGMRPDVPPEDCVLEPLAGSKRATGPSKRR